MDLIKLNWSRPFATKYPIVWRTFKAHDLNSDQLVEYRIQDLPASRFEEAVKHMISNYIKDEPLTHALNGSDDEQHIADYVLAWRSMLAQKTVLVCFKADCDDIIGVNINFVNSEVDHFIETFYKRCGSEITKTLMDIICLLYANFDPFKQYNVTAYLGSFGLSVDRKYRGRSIGTHFLEARKAFCQEFGLKLTHTIFSSNFSNQNADKAGFKTDLAIGYNEIIKLHPEWPLSQISSKELTQPHWSQTIRAMNRNGKFLPLFQCIDRRYLIDTIKDALNEIELTGEEEAAYETLITRFQAKRTAIKKSVFYAS